MSDSQNIERVPISAMAYFVGETSDESLFDVVLRVPYRLDKPIDPRYKAHWDSLFRQAINMPVYRIERDEK